MSDEPLIPPHGSYRKLKSFRIAQLIYDVTERFCERYIDRRSRTRDQMVQAARSGVQNIAEGSQASGTSKKTEIKLTNVARASLEELRLDYEDYLRQRELPLWPPDHPALKRFKARRCATLQDVRAWLGEERRLGARKGTDRKGGTDENTDRHGQAQEAPAPTLVPPEDGPCKSVPVRESPCESVSPLSVAPVPAPVRAPSPDQLVANAALSLLNLCCYLLDRQLAAQSAAFERDGGFTERLYRVRSSARKKR